MGGFENPFPEDGFAMPSYFVDPVLREVLFLEGLYAGFYFSIYL